MVVCTTCISTSRVVAAALLLVVAQTHSAHAQPAEPLASVVLRFEVASTQYGYRLRQDRLTALQRVMVDSLREMLQARFPFIKWDLSGASATYAMVFRVTPAPNSPQAHVLEIEVISASGPGADSFRTDFENPEDFGARRDWELPAVARSWLVRANRILENQSQRLVEHVIGQLPIAAEVNILRDSLKVLVYLAAERLNAAARPPLKLRIAVTVVDEGPEGHRTRDPAQLQLAGCRVGYDKTYYYCDIDSVTYADKTGPAHRYRSLLKRAQLVSPSLHLLAYRARPQKTSGAVTGVVGVP